MALASFTASGLHVEQSGEGEPVLLLHSSGLSGRQWRKLAQALSARGKRAIVPDLTGHGASAAWPSPVPFSFRRDVDAVIELLAIIGSAHVVGHSYGGLVALHAAVAAPGSVRSLVLHEPVAFGVLDPTVDADARAIVGDVRMDWGTTAEQHERWLQGFVDFWGGSGAWNSLRNEARDEFRRIGWVVREGVRSLVADTTRGATFGSVLVPTHLFTSERSPIPAQRVVQRLGQVMHHARVTHLPSVGHMAPIANADVVNPLLLDALVAPP